MTRTRYSRERIETYSSAVICRKGETVSVVACCSATGEFLPPYVIFKGVHKREELGDGLPPG